MTTTPFIQDIIEAVIDGANVEFTPNGYRGVDYTSEDGMTVRMSWPFASREGVEIALLDSRGNDITTVRLTDDGAERQFSIDLARDVVARMIESI